MNLTGKQRRFLRAQGHALKPLVWIGKQGIADNVLAQLDSALTSRELVKVKLLESGPLSTGECAAELAQATGAAVAQTLGHTILLYRPHPERPVLQWPAGQEPSPARPSPARRGEAQP